ncbi:hypothetical protein [Spirosoma linguale]|uniref:Uncharacterized protein n=1 Tax=Spirosoma linguale (strain ATCC 33905 / DSM 74 / LMG 10896 / Claus 1) TaxID=504472 RepID=D2QN74_SPILD|nr:hypothetical protein Slin_3252 [Spirosoma linguale DSM 74]
MVKFKKIVVSALMVIVWFVMFAMLIPMKSGRGQFVTVFICLTINGVLAAYYSCLDRRPATFREWLKM